MFPRLVALCGNPGSGKSTAGEIMKHMMGYTIADDGLPLRQIAMRYFGLTHAQCFTQAGKLEEIDLVGRRYTAREVLGELGNAFEEKFGGDIIPMMTHATLDPVKPTVLTSVRREQGRYWAAQGALVVEIVMPGLDPSPYEFDRYNPEHVHRRAINDGPSLGLTVTESMERFESKLREVLLGH